MPTLIALTLLCSAAQVCAAPEQVDSNGALSDAALSNWVLSKLARPAPMRTAFVELRGSKLLKAPLRIEGEYQRPRDDTLVREVRAPYLETSIIRNGEISIARGGNKPRTYSLSRAPELAGLQSSFGALLTGDRALLQQHYRIASDGTRQQWTLTLTPKDAKFAAQVRDLILYGRGAELRCIETRPAASANKPAADVQRTLLAGAAHAATGVSDGAALAALCHNTSAR